MKVYELYSSTNGNHIIVGASDKDAQIWDMRKYTKIMDLETKYGLGGKRLAISDNGRFCAAAAYNRFGLTLYNAKNGDTIWNIKEIKNIQKIKFTKNDENLSVSNNENQTFILDLANGKIISKTNGARNIIYNTYGNDLIMNDYYIKYNEYMIEPKAKKLILDACCLPNGFTCSTIGGGLYVYNADGILVWKADNKKNEHFVSISYLKKYNYICGIIYKYDSPRTTPYYVVYCYDAETGCLKYGHDLDEGFAYAFIRESEQIISGSGRVFQLNEDGTDVITKIKF